MVETLVGIFENVPKEVAALIISMLPIVELRGGIIASKLMAIPLSVAFPICVFGNVLPMPVILIFLNKIFAFLRRFSIFDKVLNFIDKKAEKNKEKVEKYKALGLFLFVAIPLPGTGAWTGALVANALNMPFKKSFPSIVCGVITAGVIMSVLSYFIPGLFGF